MKLNLNDMKFQKIDYINKSNQSFEIDQFSPIKTII